MLTTLIITLLAVTVLLNIIYATKRTLFDKYKGIIEFNAVMISLIVALFAYEGSTSDFDNLMNRFENIISSVEESKETLKSVKESLTYLPEQIDGFSNSINSLNRVVSRQRDQLEKTLEDFSGSIKGFQKSVDDMAQRFDRRPDLKIDFKSVETDSSIVINNIVITNHGSLLATIFVIRFQIEEKSFISFELEGSHQTEKQANFLSYQYDTDNMYVIPNKTKPRILRGSIEIKKVKGASFSAFVYYTSPFGNDGSAEAKIEYN